MKTKLFRTRPSNQNRLCVSVWTVNLKGPGKLGHIVEDTLLPTQMFPSLPARATCVADTNFKNACFCFCSETFCVRNKCFPVCAAHETSWATICPQQCALVYQGLDFVQRHFVWATNVSQFARPRKHHGQQRVRNKVPSFTRAFRKAGTFRQR